MSPGGKSKYSPNMCKKLYEYMEKGLTLKLSALKLGIDITTLHIWLNDAEKQGENSKYWDLLQSKEQAKANRALRLMEMLEASAKNRAPQFLARMLKKCDEEYDDLDQVQTAQNTTTVNNNATQTTTLTESERFAAINRIINSESAD